MADDIFMKSDLRLNEVKRRGRGQLLDKDPAVGAYREQLAAASRLVEREESLETVHHLLDALPGQKRGALLVEGPRGSGRTSFLAEAAKAATLRGLEVLHLMANPALRGHPYAAWSLALQRIGGVLPAVMTWESWEESVLALLRQRVSSDLLLMVDDVGGIDHSSLE
ncbi:MAG: AAA family ATPase [Dehalococcoidia bacterium]